MGESFRKVSGRWIVGPVVYALVYQNIPADLAEWVDRIARWPFKRIVAGVRMDDGSRGGAGGARGGVGGHGRHRLVQSGAPLAFSAPPAGPQGIRPERGARRRHESSLVRGPGRPTGGRVLLRRRQIMTAEAPPPIPHERLLYSFFILSGCRILK